MDIALFGKKYFKFLFLSICGEKTTNGILFDYSDVFGIYMLRVKVLIFVKDSLWYADDVLVVGKALS